MSIGMVLTLVSFLIDENILIFKNLLHLYNFNNYEIIRLTKPAILLIFTTKFILNIFLAL